jgi:hypothetical protein
MPRVYITHRYIQNHHKNVYTDQITSQTARLPTQTKSTKTARRKKRQREKEILGYAHNFVLSTFFKTRRIGLDMYNSKKTTKNKTKKSQKTQKPKKPKKRKHF